MPLDTFEDFQNEIDRMNGDAAYRQLRPLIDQLQAIVGAQVDLEMARIFLARIEAVHTAKAQPAAAIEEQSKAQAAFTQPNWKVDTVNQLVIQNLPRLRAADPEIPVPIVLVVMTADEATALASCDAFAEQPEALRKDFEALQADLKTNLLDGWTAQYGARPEDWRPFGGAQTIEQRAAKALQEYGESLRIQKRLVPKFIDVRTLRENRGEVLRLRRDGCIVVLDTISLRHPALLGAFQRTLLDAYPGTAVLTVVPHQKLQDLTRSLIYSLQVSLGESELSKRRIDAGEYGVCLEVTAFEDFPPWLQTRVKQICSKAIAEGGIRGDMNA